MKGIKNLKQGFTLLELLVVVLIIGILASIALPQYEMSVEKAKAAEALMNMRTIIGAVERNILLNGKDDGEVYSDPENWDIELSGGTWYDVDGEPMFVTDTFIYLPADDTSGLQVNRCIGKCKQSDEAYHDDAMYELFGCYPSVYDCPFLCFSNTEKGQKICKALEGLGVENRS